MKRLENRKLLSLLAALCLLGFIPSCSSDGKEVPEEGKEQVTPGGGEEGEKPDTPPTPDVPAPVEDLTEKAASAVLNMKTGWNLLNTLDACASEGLPSETSWGQPYTTPELLRFIADAGFGVVRVPVTWWNHMDGEGNIDPEWMARVEQVVGYVLDTGMYCIVNIHHDTGDGTQWLHADYFNKDAILGKFAHVWTQIATRFKDYPDKLLFEAYNEILDEGNNWNFARNPSAYKVINSLAGTFVETVRSTGGTNSTRNLIISTYAAASGGVSWTADSDQVLENLVLPKDSVEGHLMVEVHSYDPFMWGENHGKWTAQWEKINTDMFDRLESYFISKGYPVVIGEFGPSGGDNHSEEDRLEQQKYVRFFVGEARRRGVATCAWIDYLSGIDRMIPRWSRPDLAEAALQSWYGSDYVLPDKDYVSYTAYVRYNNQWGEYNLYMGDGLDLATYKGFRVELTAAPAPGDLQIKMQTYTQLNGGGGGQFTPLSEAVTEVLFDPSCFDGDILWDINLQACRLPVSVGVGRMVLLRHDGGEEEIETGIDYLHSGWGCTIESVERN